MTGITGRKTGDTVIGNFGEDMGNDSGERLIELCTQTSLKIWNGFLNNKNISKYIREQHTKTWKLLLITKFLLVPMEQAKIKRMVTNYANELWARNIWKYNHI